MYVCFFLFLLTACIVLFIEVVVVLEYLSAAYVHISTVLPLLRNEIKIIV